ncbi:HopJ type III effector protein [Porticoccus sp.]
MSVDRFLETLKTAPETVSFSDSIAVIEENYRFEETAFTNGQTENPAGQNNGSCKIFAFGRLNDLSEQQTLQCFGDYYRVDVLQNPEGDDHQNIRNFIEHGWPGVEFSGEALVLK